MKKISRRSFLTATGILTASAALTACSGGGSTGKAGAAASSAPASSAAASEAGIPAFSGWLQEFLTGREVLVAVLASQVTSNVPAALLLSGFTRQRHKPSSSAPISEEVLQWC